MSRALTDASADDRDAARRSGRVDAEGVGAPRRAAESERTGWISTLMSRVGARARGIELGLLTIAGLLVSKVQEARGDGGPGLQDDGVIAYSELEHGVFVLVTKEANPRVITVADPEQTVVIGPTGSSVSVVSNAGARVTNLEAAYDGAFRTFSWGQSDTITQPSRDDAQPASRHASVGSGTPFDLIGASGGTFGFTPFASARDGGGLGGALGSAGGGSGPTIFDVIPVPRQNETPANNVVTTAALIDEDALPGGNPQPGGALATVAGALAHSFGGDGAGAITFAALNGAPVLDNTGQQVKAGGQALTFHWDSPTHTLAATTGGGTEAFKVVVDPSDWHYTFTLEKALDHPLPNVKDTLTLNVGYTVTDADGDSGNGTLVLAIPDDLPSTGVTTVAQQLDDDALPGGNHGQPGDSGSLATATEGLLVHSFGADGPGDITFAGLDGAAVIDSGGQAVKAGGVALSYHWDASTHTLTATTGGGTEAFKVAIDPATWHYVFTLERPLDHPVTGTQDTLTLNLGYGITDFDGDGGTGTLVLTVRDDMPTTGVTTVAQQLDDDALPGGNHGQPGDSGSLATATEGLLAHSFGADGPGDITFAGLDGAAVIDSGGQAVKAGGQALSYHWDASTHTLTATTSAGLGGTEAFKVAVDPATWHYVFTLERPLDHPVTGTQDSLTLNLGYGITDFDGDGGTGTLVLTVRDDMPTTGVTTVAQQLDDDALPGGNHGQPGDSGSLATATEGLLAHSFGADGPGDITFAALDGAAVIDSGGQAVKAGGQALTYHWDASTHTLTATSGGGTEAFKVAVDPATWHYVFTLERPLDHPVTGTQDTLTLNLGYGITDFDGDGGTGTLVLTVRDDMPTTGVTTVAQQLDDDALPGGNHGQPGDSGSLATATEGLLAHSFGADGPGDITFAALDGAAVIDSGGQAVKAGGQALSYHWDVATHTLTATTSAGPGGTEAFKVALDPATWHYVFTLERPLDHPVTGTQDSLTLNLGYGITDFDGDGGTGTLVLTVRDDMPTTGVTTVAQQLDDDALPGGNHGQPGDSGSLATATEGLLAHSFGADGAGDIAFANLNGAAVIDSGGQQVKAGGQALSYHWDVATHTLTATTGGGTEAFNVVVDPSDWSYAFTLERPLDHPLANTQDTLTLNVGYRVTDFDGDGGTGTLVLTVRDDMPTASVVTVAAQLDEDALPGGNPGQPGDSGSTATTADGVLVHSFGADGPGDITFAALDGAAVIDSGGQAVKAGGQALSYHWDAATHTLTATTGGGTEAFKVAVDPSDWSYAFTLERPLDHPLANTQDTLTLNVGYRVTDFDGDGGTGTLVLTVRDDMPTASVVTVAALLDEDALPGGNPGQPGDSGSTATTADGVLVHSFGADGPGDITFAALDGAAVIDSGGQAVKAGGQALTYHWDAATHTLTATTGGGTEAFNVAIDPSDWSYAFTLERPLDHPLANTQDTLTLNVGYRVTDFDGDGGTGTLVLTVRDDMPTAGAITTASLVSEDALAGGKTATTGGVLAHSFGADGAGDIAFANLNGAAVIDGAGQAVKAGGVALTYHWDASTHTLTATTSAGSGGTEAFKVAVDPSDWSYAFTLEKELDHPTGQDTLTLNVGYRVADADGDSGAGTLVLAVKEAEDCGCGHHQGLAASAAAGNAPAATTLAASSLQTFTFDQLGNDTLVFEPGFGHVDALQFANANGVSDKIDISGFESINDFSEVQALLKATDGGQDTTIDFGHGDTITLVDVKVTSLHSSDFIVHHV